jgi:transposase
MEERQQGRPQVLKGHPMDPLRYSSNRSPKDTESLKSLEPSNRPIYRASQLKDEFDQFWEFKDIGEAERQVRKWMTSVRRSRMEPMKDLVRTLENHFDDVLAFIGTPISNPIAEGLNRVIKIVKNRASGFRKVDSFTDMIYLKVGDLDLPAQIPAKFPII